MTKTILLAAVAAATALTTLPIASASAQSVDVIIQPTPGYVPPRGGAFGDRDRDGVPNIADNYNNNRGGRGDQDRDGVPNRYDRDRDGDGVPNRYDNNPTNPWRR
jgi:hypothetical protein